MGASEEGVFAEEPSRVSVEVDGHDVSPCLRCEQHRARACELGLCERRASDEFLEAVYFPSIPSNTIKYKMNCEPNFQLSVRKSAIRFKIDRSI